MTEYVHLIGAEDVLKAGASMREAAQEMQRAASSIEDTMFRHRQFLEDWAARLVTRLEAIDAAVAQEKEL